MLIEKQLNVAQMSGQHSMSIWHSMSIDRPVQCQWHWTGLSFIIVVSSTDISHQSVCCVWKHSRSIHAKREAFCGGSGQAARTHKNISNKNKTSTTIENDLTWLYFTRFQVLYIGEFFTQVPTMHLIPSNRNGQPLTPPLFNNLLYITMPCHRYNANELKWSGAKINWVQKFPDIQIYICTCISYTIMQCRSCPQTVQNLQMLTTFTACWFDLGNPKCNSTATLVKIRRTMHGP